MSKKTTRAAISLIVVGSALSLLMYTTLSEGGVQYYKHVDEVMTSPAEWYGKPMQLHGHVVDGSILQRRETLDYKFKIRSGEHMVTAMYTGVVPDTFKDGSEVVLRGRLTADGFQVEKGGVMAKCPSKYEPGAATPGSANSAAKQPY
jgi:cytochrome c-type biogenesis protein CcmE